jgi:hypothetical protein
MKCFARWQVFFRFTLEDYYTEKVEPMRQIMRVLSLATFRMTIVASSYELKAADWANRIKLWAYDRFRTFNSRRKLSVFNILMWCGVSFVPVLCFAQSPQPIRDLTSTLQSDSNGDHIVFSWSINDNVPTSTFKPAAIASVSGIVGTLPSQTVPREGTSEISVPSVFHLTINYGGGTAPQISSDVKKITIGITATSIPGVPTATPNNYELVDYHFDLDAAQQYFEVKHQLKTVTDSNATAQKLVTLFKDFANNYPRKVIWEATPFNDVIVIRATSTYTSIVKVVATPQGAPGARTVTINQVALPPMTTKEFHVEGLSPKTTYKVELSEAPPEVTQPPSQTRPSSQANGIGTLTFDPASKTIGTTNLPDARVRFTIAGNPPATATPVNISNAQIQLPLEIQGAQQLKVTFSETRPGQDAIVSLSQITKLKSECQNTDKFVPCTVSIPFTAEEGKFYAVDIQPLTPFQAENPDQNLKSNFTGLRSILADAVAMTFGIDGITFSAKSSDKIKLQVIAQPANQDLPFVEWGGIPSSSAPSVTIKYTQLPAQPADGLRLTIGLQADDSTKRTQSQTIVMKVSPPPAATGSDTKRELTNFGSALMSATPGSPTTAGSNPKLSLKSILTTGLGVFLKVLFPVIP